MSPAGILDLSGLEAEVSAVPQVQTRESEEGVGALSLPGHLAPGSWLQLTPPWATSISEDPLFLSGSAPGSWPSPVSRFPPGSPTTSGAQASPQGPKEGARCGSNPPSRESTSSNPSSTTSQLSELRRFSLSLSLLIC